MPIDESLLEVTKVRPYPLYEIVDMSRKRSERYLLRAHVKMLFELLFRDDPELATELAKKEIRRARKANGSPLEATNTRTTDATDGWSYLANRARGFDSSDGSRSEEEREGRRAARYEAYREAMDFRNQNWDYR